MYVFDLNCTWRTGCVAFWFKCVLLLFVAEELPLHSTSGKLIKEWWINDSFILNWNSLYALLQKEILFWCRERCRSGSCSFFLYKKHPWLTFYVEYKNVTFILLCFLGSSYDNVQRVKPLNAAYLCLSFNIQQRASVLI